MSENPLLNIKIPGETIRLPSMGLFYTPDELEATDGEVHVYPMSAIDEIVMRSVDKLLNGDSIIEVFKRCIPEVKNPGRLFAKDVDTLLLTLRKVTYGPTVDVKSTHTCEGAKEHTYTVTLDQFISSAKSLDPTKVSEQFRVTMESGQVVTLNPIRFNDIVKLMQDTSLHKDMTVTKMQEKMFESTISIIASVDGVTERAHIAEWARTIPTTWFGKISQSIDSASDWGPSTKYTTTCQDCGEEITMNIELSPLTFFL